MVNHGRRTFIRECTWTYGVPFTVVENDQVYLIRTDHIRRPVFATDTSGTVVWEATYLPFGGGRVSSGDPIALRLPPHAHPTDALPGRGSVVPV